MLPPKKKLKGKKMFTFDTEHCLWRTHSSCFNPHVRPKTFWIRTFAISGVLFTSYPQFRRSRSRARSSLAGGSKVKWRNAEVILGCVRGFIRAVPTAQVYSKSRVCVAVTPLTSCLEERTTFGGLHFEGTHDKKEMTRYIRLAVCLFVLVAGAHCWDDGECYVCHVFVSFAFNYTLIRVLIWQAAALNMGRSSVCRNYTDEGGNKTKHDFRCHRKSNLISAVVFR